MTQSVKKLFKFVCRLQKVKREIAEKKSNVKKLRMTFRLSQKKAFMYYYYY